MKFDGLDFKRSKTLVARPSKTGDKYTDGTDVPENYLVFVKGSDCKLVGYDTRNNLQIVDPKDAKPISDMTGHSLTNKVYGKWKNRKPTIPVWVYDNVTKQNVLSSDYYQMTVYLCLNGKVYTSSVKRLTKPN